LPLGGAAAGITTTGLEYPLAAETLASGSTRGVSNVFAGTDAHVRVTQGVLLAIRPDGASR
jgi:thiamine pyrophosphokinase